MGQEGNALVFLTPSETAYVDFIRLNKGMNLECYPTPSAPCVRDSARSIICQERSVSTEDS